VQRALVKILKGALKEKGKGIPLSTAALPLLNFYFYCFFSGSLPPRLLSLSA
jgi:hypothetical protein